MMEIVDNAIVLLIPGAIEAGLADVLFWGSLAFRSSPPARRLPRGPLVDRARARPRGRPCLPLTPSTSRPGAGAVRLDARHGALRPLDPAHRRVQANGHETLVVGPPTLKARGYEFEAGAPRRTRSSGRCGGRCRRFPCAGGGHCRRRHLARLNVDAMLPKHDEVLERWRPDLVVRESAEFASAIAAERHGVPHVRVAASTSYVEHGALGIAGARDRGKAGGHLRPRRRVAVPDVLPAVGRSRPVRGDAGAPAASDTEPSALPDWWPGLDGPLVYVSFGSVAATFRRQPRSMPTRSSSSPTFPCACSCRREATTSSSVTCRATSGSSGGSTSRRSSGTPPRWSATAGQGRR